MPDHHRRTRSSPKVYLEELDHNGSPLSDEEHKKLIEVLGIRPYPLPRSFFKTPRALKLYWFLGTDATAVGGAEPSHGALVALSIDVAAEEALGRRVVSAALPPGDSGYDRHLYLPPGTYSSSLQQEPRRIPFIRYIWAEPGVNAHGDAEVTIGQPVTLEWEVLSFGATDTEVWVVGTGPNNSTYQRWNGLPLKGSMVVFPTKVGTSTYDIYAHSLSSGIANGSAGATAAAGVLVFTDAVKGQPAPTIQTTTITVWLEPQPLFEGVVPYVAQLLPITGGVLQAIQNPATALNLNSSILLVKVGYTTADCATNPDAYIQINAGQTTTEMTTLFGTTSLVNGLFVVACADSIGSDGNPAPVAISMTYTHT